ncbi:hypothetical protein [Blastopirellula retiformator]|uniref:Uncharacterized protein n=1 Tax=Blastopirellula retiformator TaxID=2527970 RepID=A0A5C5VMC6_9BACT|nr:hypothetical protein [Blastopirellula retiformator]TWT39207.1 hypothetical protein Enr8_09030 [Blastopirellula retiformator]
MICNYGLTLLGFFLLVASAAAEPQPRVVAQNAVSIEAKSPGKKASRANQDDAVSESELARREELAFALVRKHHPELVTLLRQLKQARPRQYDSAIRELSRVSERLDQIQERSPERYEVELELWKSKSRLQLLTAQLRMTPDDQPLRERLRETIAQQLASQRQLYELEKTRMTQRIEFLNKQLDRLDGDVETLIDQRFRSIEAAAKRAPKNRGGAAEKEKKKK